VVEDGTTGFMGQKVKFDPETAHARRVEARLGTAIRDNATVLIATDDSAAAVAVVGTADLIPIAAGRGRRSTAPDLPRRLLLRNLWVAESRRRQGIARQLMTAVETETVKQGVSLISLEVDRTNVPAITLYRDLGFEEIEESPNLPKWMQGMLPPLVLGKWLE
jgi:ribosomal protein S18 acetylase RimI-like enzyme